MPLDEFWYGDEELLTIYVKAYYEDARYHAWINGYYTYIANVISTSNTWGGKDGKDVKYPDYNEEKNKYKVEIKEKPRSKDDNHFISQFY